ncbi:unnamed protein product [Clavelina lepadiformis]|uniref:Ribosomal protein S14 n=1 Tax=Clavelina lepadiformis TaxID=159417 RepID=A0ABP0H1M6_CLALP
MLDLEHEGLVPSRMKHSSRRSEHKRKNLRVSAEIPKGGAVPPDHETVAYVPVPPHLTPEGWGKRGQLDRTYPMLWHENWVMQRDARKRALATLYGPLRLRLGCLQFNGFLPLELKQVADQEICTFPYASNKRGVVNRCVLTSRPRGKRRRWRLSRMMFRHFADHGQMCGITRAKW